MKKRVLSLLLCGLMTAALLAGCGSKEAPASDAPTETDAETEAPAGAEESGDAQTPSDGENAEAE